MRDKLILFIEKYGLYLFSIILLLLLMFSSTSQTIHQVRSELSAYPIDSTHIEIILAQSVLESGWYQSTWTHTHSNIFGLTKSKNGTRVPQVFDNWKICVRSYYNQIYKKYLKTKGDYFSFLIKLPYAMDKGYIPKLKNLIPQLPK